MKVNEKTVLSKHWVITKYKSDLGAQSLMVLQLTTTGENLL